MATTKKKTPRKSGGKAARVKKPAAKDYLKRLQEVTGKNDPDWGMFSEDLFATTVEEWIPTGSLAIDRLTGGGWPMGRIVEVASWEGVGKTTLLDQSLAQVQRMGGVGALVDSENARDENYTQTLGVNIDELLANKAETIEEVFLAIDRILDIQEHVKEELKGEQPPPLLIVWDAIGGTPTKAEQKGAPDDAHVGVAARNIKQNFRRLALRLPKLRATLVCANHYYKTIGPFSTLKTYGGSGIQYFASLRLGLSRKETIKVGNSQVGHVVEAKIKKTRIGKPQPPVETGLIWGSGLDNSYTLLEWGKKHGAVEGHTWIRQSGAWYYLMHPDGTHETFQQGFAGLGPLLAANQAVYEAMAKGYLNGD